MSSQLRLNALVASSRACKRLAISLAALAAALASALAVAPVADAVSFHGGHGLRVVSSKQLDARLLTVAVKTAALPGPANIRILLPSGYASQPHRRYPVFYLLHGTSGGAPDWTKVGGAEQTTAGLPMIVVMPDIALNYDGGGWCTNWPDGKYKWETFHVEQLIPWVDANLRTVASRAGRAIAGLSQGGFCSMSYAARHPDLFATALAYSGAPDIAYDADARAGSTAIINATEVGLDHVPANSMFGDRTSNEINWAAHDPTTLAENLRLTKLYEYFGDGQPGPYDSSPNPSAMSIEGAVWRDNIDFHSRLQALGIPNLYDPYGHGTHIWPYWARDLRWSIGAIMANFRHPPATPTTISYQSADPAYSVYGWQVTTHRKAREFSNLSAASAHGFSLAGSGSATVLTAPSFTPGKRYRVRLFGEQTSKSRVVRAGRSQRLKIDVVLGPSNPYQEYTSASDATGTAVYTTRVTIARVR